MRIDADTDAAVGELRTAEETMTDAINRVLRIGVEKIRDDMEEKPQEPEPEEEPGRDVLIETLQAHIGTLTTQLDTKDAQITALTDSLRDAQASLRAAQTLHAADKPTISIEATSTAQDGPKDAQGGQEAQDVPTGFWARLWWAISR